MKLTVYEPAYYTKINGSDPEIKAFLEMVSSFVITRTYSPVITDVSIAPVVAPKEIIDQGLWAESTKCWPSSNDAAIFIHVPYDEYVNASCDGKKRLLLSAVFSAMDRIKKKGKRDANKFKEDVMECIKREPDLLG